MNLRRLLLAAAIAASTCAVALPAHAAPADKKDKDEDTSAVAVTVADDGSDGKGKDKSPKPTPTPKATPTPKPTPAPKATPQPKDDAGAANDSATPAGDTPGQTAAELAPVAPPVAGESVAATVTDGTVRVRLPGTDTYLPLTDAASMPVGAVVDARRGEVVMQVALRGKPAESVTFSGSMFELHQGKKATTIRLRGGDFGKCEADTHFLTVAGRKKPKAPVVRSLWASDHGGHFRTHGHNSVATVRGTTWLTEDRCDGTLTRVTSGAVEVYDNHTHRKVLVRAGHSYLARHP